MATRTGCADLPLHSGHVPHWLATRMASLGRVIVEAIVHHYGRDEVLRRLAHPSGPDFESVLDEERARSSEYGGRAVFGAGRLRWP